MCRKYVDCLRLNLRIVGLALRNRWIGNRDIAESYTRLSARYGQNWLAHLRPATHKLLSRLPETLTGPILDLGCGTGETTRWLSTHYPEATIYAQDLSEGMLQAAQRMGMDHHIEYSCGDMLEFLRQQQADSVELMVSAWAIGYSHPGRVLKEASRALQPNGRFAFVVNLMDTLQPVYVAFRQTMQRHSEKLKALSWPHFPRSLKQFEHQAQSAGLKIEWKEEGRLTVCHPGEASLSWLLNTGILAGFDAMLPLRDDPAVAACFEECLKTQRKPLEHHYIMAVLQKHE